MARRSLEREVARLNAAAETTEGGQFEYLEQKLASRDAQVGALRKERNALLASLRQQQREVIGHARVQGDMVQGGGGRGGGGRCSAVRGECARAALEER